MSNDEATDPTLIACRKLLQMVAELHGRGYESLRVYSGFSPSGAYWRCDIGPASPDRFGGVGSPVARYSSSAKAEYFKDWGDCADLTVESLADRFEQSFADVLEKSTGSDPAYVKWFADMLTQTEPCGLIYSFADWEMDKTVMHVTGQSKTETIPLPPS